MTFSADKEHILPLQLILERKWHFDSIEIKSILTRWLIGDDRWCKKRNAFSKDNNNLVNPWDKISREQTNSMLISYKWQWFKGNVISRMFLEWECSKTQLEKINLRLVTKKKIIDTKLIFFVWAVSLLMVTMPSNCFQNHFFLFFAQKLLLTRLSDDTVAC